MLNELSLKMTAITIKQKYKRRKSIKKQKKEKKKDVTITDLLSETLIQHNSVDSYPPTANISLCKQTRNRNSKLRGSWVRFSKKAAGNKKKSKRSIWRLNSTSTFSRFQSSFIEVCFLPIKRLCLSESSQTPILVTILCGKRVVRGQFGSELLQPPEDN